jgi:hypothetical protein
MNSQHVSAQISCHQAILEEYENGDGIHINYYATKKILRIRFGWV